MRSSPGANALMLSVVMSSDVLIFPPFRLDVVNEELWRGSERIGLRPKTFAVLAYLARHSRRLVTKRELLNNVWARVAVRDDLLRGYVRELRAALGDDAKAPRYLVTVARRGYKFLPHVTSAPPPASATPSSEGAGASFTPDDIARSLELIFPERAIPPRLAMELVELAGARAAAAEVSAVSRAAPGRPKDAITVGILHSLTGVMARTESPVVDATLFAIEELNQRGGIDGAPIHAVVADGQSDERAFEDEAEHLIGKLGIDTLFGCWTSASRKAVRKVVERANALLFYPVQFEGMEQSPNIVYTGAAPNQQILPAVRWAFGFLRKRRFFLVGHDSVFSWAAHAMIRDEVEALGGEIAGEAYVSGDSTNVAEVVANVIASKPELIVNSLGGDRSVQYLRALRGAGVTPERIPTLHFSLGELELTRLAAFPNAGDYGAWNYFQSVDRARNRAFISRFRSRFGSDRVIADPMEAAYLGVNLWAQAVRAAGTDDAQRVRNALRNQTFDAPEGPVQIDPENQYTWKTMRLGRIVESGQFEVIWSSERPVRPEAFASSRSPASWNAFLSDLFTRWDGHWSRGISDARALPR